MINKSKGFVYIPFGLAWMIIFCLAYSETLAWMYQRCISPDTYYSHSFLIPFVTGYLIWLKRRELSEAPVKKSWAGLGVFVFGALMHIAGSVLYIFSISGFSIFFILLGLVLFLFGKDVTRIILFPLLYLLFMFPLPLAVINLLSFPMKMLVAKAGSSTAYVLGVPVFREGFNISIPAGILWVGNPCSGLRSLISFLALGAIFAHISDISTFRKIILFALAIPIALVSNMVRVSILILISHFWGLEHATPESVWHGASGVFVFLLGMMVFINAGKVLEWKS